VLLTVRRVRVSAEGSGTINLDLGQQRAERAVLGVVSRLAELSAGFLPVRGRYATLLSGMGMAAAAGRFSGLGVNAARSIAARQQAVERLPEQPERRKRQQRAEREAAIHSGNQG
jgi:hypothetical protein